MNTYQPIYNIASISAHKGITDAVLCPGSRCAPLTLAFTRHPQLTCRTFSDERSAGFVALGIAQQQQRPVIFLCTSGSAAYNVAPAVAEAYFSETPLLIFTADRPAEWIAQQDGQTIYQAEIFGKHVKKSYQLPQAYDHPDCQWAINRMVNEAINFSMQEPKGPVHINAPFREPLYPGTGEEITFDTDVRIIEQHTPSYALSAEQQRVIQESWSSFHNILIVSGQQQADEALLHALNKFFDQHNLPIAGDIISNLHTIPKLIRYADVFLGQATEGIKKTLKPDLLITFGQSTISKNLKVFLRQYAPQVHWHVQPHGIVADPFQHVSNIFNTTPNHFFTYLASLPLVENFENQKQSNYTKLWEVEERRAVRTLSTYFPQEELGELDLLNEVIQQLPENCALHLANSMSVRYANFIGLKAEQKGIQVFSNRGTSGIDGCTSTMIGHSLASTKPHVLITGDLAFFYDRNAFWNNYAIPNCRVVLLNNHGGIIFKMIDGPSHQPEAEQFFVTDQKLTATKLCEEFGFEHLKLNSKRKLKNLLKDFFDFDGKTKILELESSIDVNYNAFNNLKEKIKNSYDF